MSGADDDFEAQEAALREQQEANRAIVTDLLEHRGVSMPDLVEYTRQWDDEMFTDLFRLVARDRPVVAAKVQYGPELRYKLEVMQEHMRLRVRHEAQQRFKDELLGASESDIRMVDGGAFILDLPDEVPCLWGSGSQIVWAEGEAVMLVGSPGVGKTTIAGQVVRARLVGGEVLGMPVEQTAKKVLYLAMDRPQQIARALARQLSDVPREVLEDRLVVWPGPPVADVSAHPEILLQMAQDAGVDTVFVDSLKDAAIGLSADEVGAGYNRARQLCLAAGVSLFELHHMKKQGGNGSGKASRPTKLEDVYGSVWLTAGAGSVVLLHGEAGDGVVEWKHLKQPAEPVGPFTIEHDHLAGTSEVYLGTDPYDFLHSAGAAGVTVKEFALRWLGSADNSTTAGKAATSKARRKLDSWVRTGAALLVDPGDRATSMPARYAVSTIGRPIDDFDDRDLL